MRILVIEDEPTIREEVVDWLTFEGHEAIAATNGREGLERAQADLPDLIISDITMPELDGYQVLVALQNDPRTRSIPFIFLTARADKSFQRHGMELGADDYITKPFTRAELMAAIKSRLSRRQVIADDARQDVEALKSRLIQMVSQELNTPLASLMLVQQIIERQLGQMEAADMADLLQTMRASTDRLQHLSQQAVYMAEIESGMVTAEKVREAGRVVYLWQLLPAAIDMARRYAFRNRQGVIIEDQRDPDAPVWGHSTQLKYALAEMLARGLQSSQEGELVTVTLSRAGSYIWVSVLDYGSVPAAEAQQGLSIGLNIAQRIAELHGGMLRVEPAGDRGTQVALGLPVHPRA